MEFVYVVPRAALFRECYPQGFVPFAGAREETAFEEAVLGQGYFVERAHAEHAPDLKQVIPYTVVVRGGEVLLLRRLARGGESRLHDKLSIGVGGHINPEDLPGEGPTERRRLLETGTRRELEEELAIEGRFELRRAGLMNDDSNPVGAVHLGLVQVAFLQGDAVVRERDLLEGRFVRPAELRRLSADGAPLETWSALLLGHLEALLPPAAVRPKSTAALA
jgi:predicted NUDIX family phosphoesterase